MVLAGTPFELIADHRPLVAIINSKYVDQITSPCLIRLKEKLSPYCMTGGLATRWETQGC